MSTEREQPPAPIEFDQVIRLAKETLLRDGYHAPTLIVDGSRWRAVIEFSELAPNHEGRASQMFSVGTLLARGGKMGRLRHVFFISEGWMSVPHEGKLPDVLPSQDPNRKEMLVITGYEERTRQTTMALFEMIRDPEGALRELRDFVPAAGGETRAESPLLAAFAAGFDMGTGTTIHRN